MRVKYSEDACADGSDESFGQEHELCEWLGKALS